MAQRPQVLDADAITTALADLDGWDGDADGLRRTVAFADFRTAIRAVGEVAEVAEELDHHPDIDIRWREVTFVNSTHSAGGVTDNDVDLARRINTIVARHPLADG
jgi:4a-hydroxytetrahydrobiopterin dehydratase